MVGYWHGDSCCAQLLLQQLSLKKNKIKVIVTADKRGDTIEKMINRHGGEAIRLPDGLKMRPFFKELRLGSKARGEILAASLDGPLGPLHEPKKLLFLLASQADKEMVYLHFQYRNVLRLENRWDRYAIPLPFCRITAEVEELGRIGENELRNFKEYRKGLIW
jgi:lysophospholipid acyltransferase (LPLAT)-like uncharacterized protein